MRVTLLGTGGPRPDPARMGPATLISAEGLEVLCDAGRGAAAQLVKAGLGVGGLDAVFVTHHHFDHIGGLGDLLMAAWNDGRRRPLPVFGPPGTAEIVGLLLRGVYERDVRYRMAEEAVDGVALAPPWEMVGVEERVDGSIDLGRGVSVEVATVDHGGDALGLSSEEWTAVGYRVSAGGCSVAVSGDAVAGEGLAGLASGADILIMCAYLAADEILTDADRFLVRSIIAGVSQAAEVAHQAGVGRLVLTHIRKKTTEAAGRMVQEASRVFAGEVIVGEDLLAIDV